MDPHDVPLRDIEPTACVTIVGARVLHQRDHRKLTDALVKVLLDPSVHAVILGGAEGVDTVALRFLHQLRTILRKRRPEVESVRLIVVVPDELNEQPWEAVRAAKDCADEIIELHHEITEDDHYAAFTKRNEYMVNCSSKLLSFWNGKNGASKTMMAYARSKSVETFVVRITPPPPTANRAKKRGRRTN